MTFSQVSTQDSGSDSVSQLSLWEHGDFQSCHVQAVPGQ